MVIIVWRRGYLNHLMCLLKEIRALGISIELEQE